MQSRSRRLLPLLKLLLVLAILAAIGYRFAKDLRLNEQSFSEAVHGLWSRVVRPQWLVPCCLFYLLALGLPAYYWFRLLRSMGYSTPLWPLVRAHYLGQLGKYLPGKAWALIVRAGAVQKCGVSLGLAAFSSFYEILITMAAGSLLATILFALQVPDWFTPFPWSELSRVWAEGNAVLQPLDLRLLAGFSLLLFCPVGFVVLPRTYNWLAQLLFRPFRAYSAAPLPPVTFPQLVQGLALTGGCWILMGLSLWALLQAVLGTQPALDWPTLSKFTAYIAMAYVTGFLILFVPSGLGVRELLLGLCLAPVIGQAGIGGEQEILATTTFAVVFLRVLWTASDVLLGASIYWLPSGGATPEATSSSIQPREYS